jgi:hypothetical protein
MEKKYNIKNITLIQPHFIGVETELGRMDWYVKGISKECRYPANMSAWWMIIQLRQSKVKLSKKHENQILKLAKTFTRQNKKKNKMNWDKTIRLAIERLEKDLGRVPFVEEVCTEIGMSCDKLEKNYRFYYNYLNKN